MSALALLTLAGCASKSSFLEESEFYRKRGQPQRAFLALDQERRRALAAGEQLDPAFERRHTEARREFLLARGRLYIFLELEDEALVALAGLLALSPGHEEALQLRERAIYKKALRASQLGDTYLAKRLLTEAMAAFLEAERLLPTLPQAHAGQLLVQEEVEKLTLRAQQQFLEAIRKLPEFRYAEVRWHSSNAIVNDPARDDAKAINERAQHELAIETIARGDANKNAGHFGAALMEYLSVQEQDESWPGIGDLIAEMELEIEASKIAETAQMRMRQLRFDEARQLLDEAFAMSIRLRGDISELMIQNRRLEGAQDYIAARDFERLGKKSEALEAFVLLAAKWPDGLEDEKGRIDALQSDIDSAKKEWALAEAAEQKGELETALEHYEASYGFYERMADAKARIERLEKAIAAKGK